MLLSEKEYKRSGMKPQSAAEERRYFKVKRYATLLFFRHYSFRSFISAKITVLRTYILPNRSMAAIKRVLSERHKIIRTLREQEAGAEDKSNVHKVSDSSNEQIKQT